MRNLDDLVLENCDEETIKSYFEYCAKYDQAKKDLASGNFIICSKELAEQLNNKL